MNQPLFLANRGIRQFRRTLRANLASIAALATVIFVFQLFLAVGLSLESFFDGMTDVTTVRAYLATDDHETIAKLTDELSKLDGVNSVAYYDRDAAAASLKDSTENIRYLDTVPTEFFPAFIELTVSEDSRNLRFVRQLEARLSRTEGIMSASYGRQWVEHFIGMSRGMKMFLGVMTMLLAVALAFIVSNTVRLNLYRFRQEIRIYSLVGASRSFIIVPYVIASLTEVIVSFLLAALALYAVLSGVNHAFLEPLSIRGLVLPSAFQMGASFLFAALLAGGTGFFSVNLFLNRVSSVNEP